MQLLARKVVDNVVSTFHITAGSGLSKVQFISCLLYNVCTLTNQVGEASYYPSPLQTPPLVSLQLLHSIPTANIDPRHVYDPVRATSVFQMYSHVVPSM